MQKEEHQDAPTEEIQSINSIAITTMCSFPRQGTISLLLKGSQCKKKVQNQFGMQQKGNDYSEMHMQAH